MPVPVPTHTKPPAHPVFKPDNGPYNPFHSLTNALPAAPTGPPPSFGTRQEWIDSLPSWRRTKPRRIWEDDSRQQDFSRGLAVAANASVIKGEPAQACIPPLFTTSAPIDDDELDSPSSPISQRLFESGSQWSASSPDPMVSDFDMNHHDDMASCERGAFTPIFEDQYPDDNAGSSPIEPLTPFGDFIDRAVAAAGHGSPYHGHYGISAISNDEIPYGINKCGDYDCYPSENAALQEPKEPVLPQEIVTPSASTGYKKLAEPLSQWVANYVWKACTSEAALPYRGVQPTFHKQYSKVAPEYLAPAIHSLLLSTLLQPSAVILALWYIVRLPISFGAIGITEKDDKEIRFRTALLGAAHGHNSELMEASAPFRLTVLGCMLANKWLDDHTFSNKTWHTISNVPIHALNLLESLALDIFAYDLNISSTCWSQWLGHILTYHSSLPSANPLSIIRKAIDEIVQAPVACNFDPSHPQPVFLGLEERRKEKLEREQAAMSVEVADFDIDEGGPLREEYIPKRRVSGAASIRSERSRENVLDISMDWARPAEPVKGLPPPAKWSPAGDEPILRDRNRGGAQYVAVQPSTIPYHMVPYPHHEVSYQTPWPAGYVHAPMAMAYAYEVPTLHPLPVYGPVAFAVPVSHSRSQSHYSYQDTSDPHNHLRSYSQSHFPYKCGDLRMSAQELPSPPGMDGRWDMPQQLHAPPAYPLHPSVGYPSAWLRT
ncbi:hypothetical protein BDZ89DRAFT_1097789 [Hymenopellis radicata]|nr:hypothetical protein BDZ89DRAFT_1097789 [Hymenopellis radicata]